MPNTPATRLKTYSHVLFDLDHTLFDTEASLELAFGVAMRAVGVEVADHYPTFQTINSRLWKQVEAGTITPSLVHTRRFEELREALDLEGDPLTMADGFAGGMQAHGDLYPGAFDLLEAVHPHATLALVTNGISHIQRGRVERLGIGHFFETITISTEVGSAKPNPEIFEVTMAELGNPPIDATLMVGDSFAADITGGARFGLDTCWYNPSQAQVPADLKPTYEVSSLSEVRPILT